MAARTCSRPADEAAFWRERAELLEAQNTRLAGENVRLEAENATLAATVAAQQEQLAALKQRVVTLSRMLFGTSSEKDGAGKRQAGGQAADAWRRG